MAQSQGWVKRYIKAFCKGFFVAVPVAVTFLDRVACVARVEGASMQPSLNPGGSQSSDVVLLNHWKVRNFEVHRGDIVSLVSPKNPEQKIIKRVIALEGDIVSNLGESTCNTPQRSCNITLKEVIAVHTVVAFRQCSKQKLGFQNVPECNTVKFLDRNALQKM
ncbi:PREDICTED: mitochondrial inner membrane protease subunit 2 isoform X2 [Mandrillus leucophaeus]|uniref:mitochondrial inner membrane protease subunit 2 isoform X2 n=1 Tax=Mandrillus leucophaeus TaxID=9568 RepID=UPI0005F4325B|nr:PREDICTED: mitochondrial inner membrane protease subunit 2 isoform X2 [Mandrillus leucophaeus]